MNVENKIVVINGSAREEGNTRKLIQHLLGADVPTYDLVNMDVSQFRYYQDYPRSDDFMIVVERMLEAQLIIIATPVYWFSMSGHMKVFLDRWTDLLSTHKAKGKSMRVKKIAVISQSSSSEMPASVSSPIELTAGYMNMEYIGEVFWDCRTELPTTDSEIVNRVASWTREI